MSLLGRRVDLVRRAGPTSSAAAQVLLDDSAAADHNSGQMYAIELSQSATADLVALRSFDRARVVAAIEGELLQQPTSATRNRKMLRELRPAWEHVPPLWQLRVGEFRVFYDVDEVEHVVYVRRVIRKGTKTTGEIV